MGLLQVSSQPPVVPAPPVKTFTPPPKSLLCCYNHPLTKWKTYPPLTNDPILNIVFQQCNKCTSNRIVMLNCQTCNYKICRVCNPVQHQDICKDHEWKIQKSNCHYCFTSADNYEYQQLQKPLVNCKNCGINICYTCHPFKHSDFCQDKKYVFSSGTEVVCIFCNQKTRSYQTCENCKFIICNLCRQNKPWE